MSAAISDLKPALLTIWSASVRKADEILNTTPTMRGGSAARSATWIMLRTLKCQIEALISDSDEAWSSGTDEDKRIGAVIDNDWRRIMSKLATIDDRRRNQ